MDVTEVAEALLLDEGTLRNYVKRYQSGGTPIKGVLQSSTMSSCTPWMPICEPTGTGALFSELYREWDDRLLETPGVCVQEAQGGAGQGGCRGAAALFEQYEKLKQTKGEQDPVYFIDGTHPQHNTRAAYGWIKQGEEKEIKSNTGRQRINIIGALNLETLSVVTRFDESINAQSMIGLLGQLERKHPEAQTLNVICDNARCYRSTFVSDYIKDSRVELVFLPPYSPNMNLIEQYWKFFKKKLYNHYYETFEHC